MRAQPNQALFQLCIDNDYTPDQLQDAVDRFCEYSHPGLLLHQLILDHHTELDFQDVEFEYQEGFISIDPQDEEDIEIFQDLVDEAFYGWRKASDGTLSAGPWKVEVKWLDSNNQYYGAEYYKK